MKSFGSPMNTWAHRATWICQHTDNWIQLQWRLRCAWKNWEQVIWTAELQLGLQQACGCHNITSPSSKWIQLSSLGKIQLLVEILWTFLTQFCFPWGYFHFRDLRPALWSGVHRLRSFILNLATHLPSPYHCLYLEINLLSPARGSLSPQKGTLNTRDPLHPWLSCTISAELLWGLRQVPNGWSNGASGWSWLYLSD